MDAWLQSKSPRSKKTAWKQILQEGMDSLEGAIMNLEKNINFFGLNPGGSWVEPGAATRALSDEF